MEHEISIVADIKTLHDVSDVLDFMLKEFYKHDWLMIMFDLEIYDLDNINDFKTQITQYLNEIPLKL